MSTTTTLTKVKASSYAPYDPNQPRGRFLKPFLHIGPSVRRTIHPILRKRVEPYFKRKNPMGYMHDLGALDVFLDNFGVLVAEQFDPLVQRRKYSAQWKFLMRLWKVLGKNILEKKPWWGKYYNSKSRRALAGEPRSLLRWLNQDDATIFPVHRFVRGYRFNSLDDNPIEPEHGIWGNDLWTGRRGRDRGYNENNDNPFINPFDVMREHGVQFDDIDWDPFSDWDCENLFPDDWESEDYRPNDLWVPGGEILRRNFSPRVDRLRILHPSQATPDLPIRVGSSKADRMFFERNVLNQGVHKTCVAHATCAALNILVRKQFGAKASRQKFSPAWLHWALDRDGLGWNNGRCVDWIPEVLEKQLPCSEETFPYRYGPSETKIGWKNFMRNESSKEAFVKFGRVLCERIEPDNIAEMKKFLAAGWILTASTSYVKSMSGSSLNTLGLPLAPFIGEHREKQGHAWTIVGYDHVDGNKQWKYQGRFLAMNSWGTQFPRTPVMGKGLVSLPFGLFLTEGVSVVALKFAK